MAETWSKQIKTTAGTFYLEAGRNGLRRLEFPGRHMPPHAAAAVPAPAGVQKIFSGAEKLLRAYAANSASPRKKIKVDWACLKGFDRKILEVLYRVPCGQTVSYAELARRSGHPKAARAVGSVMSRNRLPVFLPCHRVVRSDGTLGEYGPGRHWKKRLLAAEALASS